LRCARSLNLAAIRPIHVSVSTDAPPTPAPGALARWRTHLPRGHTLPRALWERRHRAMTVILWLHVPALLAFGLLTGVSLGHAIFEVVPVAAFAIAAGLPSLGRRGRSAMVTVGLLTCSAILVHLWDGRIEAHFHFFVMVTLLATYEEWFPYLLAFLYVLLHHGAMSGLDAAAVYDHGDAQAHPWRWAAIHALYISALGIVNIVSWRMNEDARDAMR
jgi:hypothetical protein